MKSSFSSTSPFAYQVPPSSRSHRSAENSTSKPLPESGHTSERLSKKLSRSSDEGRSKGKGFQSHSSSASTLFSQPNVTLEDMSISSPPSTKSTSTMSSSKTVSIKRPAMSIPGQSAPSDEKHVSQRVATLQPKVEDDVDIVRSTPRLAKTFSQKPMDAVRPSSRPCTSVLTTTPPPIQRKAPLKPQIVPVETKAGKSEAQHSPTSPPSTERSPAQAKFEPRRSLDDCMSRYSTVAPSNSATTSAASGISQSDSPRLHDYDSYNHHQDYASAAPLPNCQRLSPAPQLLQSMPPVNYGYLPMMTGVPRSSMYANPYYGMPFSSPTEPSLQSNEASRSPPLAEDGDEQLLEKVASVLPDINRLLNSYKATQGRLSAKELLEKQADLSHNEQLTRVTVELEATKKEYEKVIQDLVSERGKLERELTVVRPQVTKLKILEEEKKALLADLEPMRVSKRELAEALDGTRGSKEEVQTAKLANETEIAALKKALQDEKDLHQLYVADVKVQARDQMALKQREFSKIVDDCQLNCSKVQMELASLVSKHSTQKKDLDAARSSEADFRSKLALKSQEHEDTQLRHRHEIDATRKRHEQDQGKQAQRAEERVAQICRENSIKEKEWKQDFHSISAELDTQKSESQRLRDELEKLRKSKNEEKLYKSAELIESLALWRTKSDELQRQNQNLDVLLQSLGCATKD